MSETPTNLDSSEHATAERLAGTRLELRPDEHANLEAAFSEQRGVPVFLSTGVLELSSEANPLGQVISGVMNGTALSKDETVPLETSVIDWQSGEGPMVNGVVILGSSQVPGLDRGEFESLALQLTSNSNAAFQALGSNLRLPLPDTD